MKITDLLETTQSFNLKDCAIAAIQKAKVRHAEIVSIEFDGSSDGIITDVHFGVLFEFPEHFVRASEIKKAGAPGVVKCSASKGEQWKEGLWGAEYLIEMNGILSNKDQEEIMKLKDWK